MKLIFIFFLATFLTIFACTGDAGIVNSPDGVLQLRATPGGPIVKTLRNGDILEIDTSQTVTKDGYVWIRADDGYKNGWVAMKYLIIKHEDD